MMPDKGGVSLPGLTMSGLAGQRAAGDFEDGDASMIHDVTVPAALIAGVVSFLSPCVLPLVPPYLIYLTGATIEHVANEETVLSSKRAVMISAVMFVLGFSTVFVALGASASLIGTLIHAWSAELAIVAGIVIILMGLHFLGLTRIDFLMREGRLPIPKPVGLWGAYVMGLAFAFGWTPCIGPILAAILSVAAADEPPARNRRASDVGVDDHYGHRVFDRHGFRCEHLAVGGVSELAEYWVEPRLFRKNPYRPSSSVQVTVYPPPRGRKSTVASPPSWSRALRSIRREPKPRCTGAVTCGPPASVQINRNFLVAFSVITSQSTVTVPLSFDSAPYLAALVAISCTIIDRMTATRGDSGTCGPNIFIRSGLLSK